MTTGEGEVIDGFFEALLYDDAQTLYDRAPCGYLSTTPDGTIVKANATFLTLSGYAREQLIGHKRFVELLTPGGRIYHETHYAPMLRMHGVAREIALDLVCADTRRLPVLINAVLERDDAGDPVVIRTAVFDASRRRQYEEELLREKQRAEASEVRARALARTLQQTLIPPALPTIANLDLAAQYRPAGDGSEVGGDFYDIFQAGDNAWVAVIGDVCGKGAEAAVVTALARYTLRAAAMQDASPARALVLLNEALHHADTDRFCTVGMMRLTRLDATWQLDTATAGHPLPLRVDSRGNTTPIGRAGSLLGVVEDVELAEDTLTIHAGETVVGYTDGVTEARTPDGVFYGESRLRAVLGTTGQETASDIAATLLTDVLTFQNDMARDDIAIVVMKVPDDPVV